MFEWCWEHSTDLPNEDRAVLLYRFADTDPWVNGRLITARYLALDGPAQAMWFPLYEASQDTGRWTR